MGKVIFGLSDVAYCKMTESVVSGATVISYGNPKKIPGAVSLTLDVEGDDSDFYADNGVYATFDANNGFSGELTIADIPEDVYTDLLVCYKDTSSSLITEIAGAAKAYFGLMFKLSSNSDPVGVKLYKCSLSRPGMSANTTTETTDPDTPTLTLRVMPIETSSGVSVTKSHQVLTTSSIESTFFGSMTLPTVSVS